MRPDATRLCCTIHQAISDNVAWCATRSTRLTHSNCTCPRFAPRSILAIIIRVAASKTKGAKTRVRLARDGAISSAAGAADRLLGGQWIWRSYEPLICIEIDHCRGVPYLPESTHKMHAISRPTGMTAGNMMSGPAPVPSHVGCYAPQSGDGVSTGVRQSPAPVTDDPIDRAFAVYSALLHVGRIYLCMQAIT